MIQTELITSTKFSHAHRFSIAVAAAMSLPIVLFTVAGYDINPAFLLLPFIAWIAFKLKDKIFYAFVASAITGLISILLANYIAPDQQIYRHVLSLLLILISPSFVFLGRWLAKRSSLPAFILWVSTFSSIFIIAITGRILFLGQEVRIYTGPLGLANLNAEFFGLPVFAAFGVLSLADLICIQSTLICGALISRSAPILTRALFAIALACGTFLIIGSNSRSAQMMIVWIVASLIISTLLNIKSWKPAIVATLAIACACGFTYERGMTENRMLASLQGVSQIPVENMNSSPSSKATTPKALEETEISEKDVLNYDTDSSNAIDSGTSNVVRTADAFATGRVELAIQGVKDVLHRPLIGNGFSNYARYSSEGLSSIISANTSTHIYYLTLIWKGGLIFFIPFIIMLALTLHKARLENSMLNRNPEVFFTWSAVLMTFIPMAFAWDILIVPSAGALAFLLLGMLNIPATHSAIRHN